jgi:hypothetical protein
MYLRDGLVAGEVVGGKGGEGGGGTFCGVGQHWGGVLGSYALLTGCKGGRYRGPATRSTFNNTHQFWRPSMYSKHSIK